MSNLKKHFEANMLDGEPIDDCGVACLDAKEVWEYIQEVVDKEIASVFNRIEEAKLALQKELKQAELRARVDEQKQMLHKEVCEVMCGWSDKCEEDAIKCPIIRGRIAKLEAELENLL